MLHDEFCEIYDGSCLVLDVLESLDEEWIVSIIFRKFIFSRRYTGLTGSELVICLALEFKFKQMVHIQVSLGSPVC